MREEEDRRIRPATGHVTPVSMWEGRPAGHRFWRADRLNVPHGAWFRLQLMHEAETSREAFASQDTLSRSLKVVLLQHDGRSNHE
jgi:hypothetical protein